MIGGGPLSRIGSAIAGLTLLILVLAAAYVKGRWDGSAALRAQIEVAQAKARAEAADWKARAAAMQASARQQQAKADSSYADQVKAIHSAGGGDAPLDPYLAHAARLLWPPH